VAAIASQYTRENGHRESGKTGVVYSFQEEEIRGSKEQGGHSNHILI